MVNDYLHSEGVIIVCECDNNSGVRLVLTFKRIIQIIPESGEMSCSRLSFQSKNTSRGSPRLEQRYLLNRSIVKQQLRRKHAAYVHKLFTGEDKSSTEKSKQFWTYIKHRRSTNSNVGPLKEGTTLVTLAKDRAEILNNQFTSVFSQPTPRIDYNQPTLNSQMSNIKVCACGVLKQLKSLNPNKSTGPDGIPPRVLKEMADVLATPLTNLFQMSLDKRAVP